MVTWPFARRSLALELVLGFVAGAIAVAIFLQLMLFLLTHAGMIQATPYSMRPVPPWNVPTVLNQMFWGGVWGLIFVLIITFFPRARPLWLVGLLLGAIALPLVGWFVVAPLKAQPVMAGGNPTRMLASVLINGAWGLGMAFIFIALRDLAGGRRWSFMR